MNGASSIASMAKLDIHVPLTLRRPIGVGEFHHRLGHDRIAIVIEPVDQRRMEEYS